MIKQLSKLRAANLIISDLDVYERSQSGATETLSTGGKETLKCLTYDVGFEPWRVGAATWSQPTRGARPDLDRRLDRAWPPFVKFQRRLPLNVTLASRH